MVHNSPGAGDLPGCAVTAQLLPASGLCLPGPGLALRYCKAWPQWDSVCARHHSCALMHPNCSASARGVSTWCCALCSPWWPWCDSTCSTARPVLTHTCPLMLLPGLGCWGNQWQAHPDSSPSCSLLPGLRSCCCPARSSYRSHLRLSGAAAQIFWDQSDHLSPRDWTLPCPMEGEGVGHPQDPRTPLCSMGPVPYPLLSTLLLCLASTCGQPPFCKLTSHPHSQHLHLFITASGGFCGGGVLSSHFSIGSGLCPCPPLSLVPDVPQNQDCAVSGSREIRCLALYLITEPMGLGGLLTLQLWGWGLGQCV